MIYEYHIRALSVPLGKESQLLSRFRRIQDEFGTKAVLMISFLMISLLGMDVVGWVVFASPLAALIGAGGFAVGFLFRDRIAQGIEYYHVAVPIGLFVYGLVLFAGDRVGMSLQARWAIITAATAVVFNLQFWSLSDPLVVNTQQDSQ